MRCPCCGKRMTFGARECACGARIVGEPLGPTPVIVKRYGPVFWAIGSGVAVAVASLLISGWLIFTSIITILLAYRAAALARRQPALFGGFRTAIASVAIASTACVSLATYAVVRIPTYLEKRRLMRVAETEASMLHLAATLEEYNSKTGSYPTDLAQLQSYSPKPDSWNSFIKYQSYANVASASDPHDESDRPGIQFNRFELRSAGPDGIMGTADDIVMRDGVFCPATDAASKTLDDPAYP